MDVNGGTAKRLTRDLNFDTQPAFTLDGTQIIFISYGKRESGIYIIDVYGRSRRMITRINDVLSLSAGLKPQQLFFSNGNKIETFSLSPNGKQIAFVDYISPDQADVFVVNIDGTRRTRLRDMLSERTTP